MRKLSLIILTILLSISLSFAQTSRGTVSGVVKDPNGAIVPGASVTLVNTATNVERTITTNDNGFYRFDAVDLGDYSVRVKATGFGSFVKNGVSVSANQIATADAELAVGTQETVVDVVSSGGDQLQTEAAVRGGNISTRQITELPIAGNPVALALTLPGVTSNRGGFGVGTFSVNGARGRSNNFLIDGTENNDISVAGQGFQITNQDAVQEVSVQTANYDSEFGRAGGAVVNVITKSGTKNFHGTLAFEYDSSADDALTATQSRNPTIIARGRRLTDTTFIPSATFGGPLFVPRFGEGGPVFDTSRDKNFFFLAYEETRQRTPGGQVTLVVPTAAGRARLQSFAGNNPILTSYLNATANTVATVINGRSPISLDSTNAGAPQTRGLVEIGEFFRTFSSRYTEKQFQVRTDHTLGNNDQLSFRFLSDLQVQPLGGEIFFEGFDADYSADYKNFLVAETHVFNGSTTNEARFAYNLIKFGFPLSSSGAQTTQPTIGIAGLTTFGTSATFPQGRTANNFQVQDTVTHIVGNHTFRIGVDYLRQIASQIAPANIRGSITYGTGNGFTALGNFIDDLGGNGNASRFFGPQTYKPELHRIATFGQDRWKVTQDLTLTMGVRYEYFGTPFNTLFAPGATGIFNLDPVTRTGPFNQTNKIEGDKNNFAPSVGFAYSPNYADGVMGFLFGEKKSVIRAGYNLGYDSFFNNIASNAATSSPNGVVTTTTSIVVAATSPRGISNFSNQVPTVATAVTPLSAQTLIAAKLVNPYYQRWSVGFQRELPLKLLMDVSYVGSKGTKLFGTQDDNPLVRPDLRSANPTGYPVTCTIGLAVTAAQATTQFPAGTLCPYSGRLDNIQGSRQVRSNFGASSYHAGQLSVTRRFANSFQLTGSYTYAKNLSNVDEVFGQGLGSVSQNSAFPVILGGERLDRALSTFDRTHRASFTYVIQSPFFKDQKGFIGKALGGFQLSGITTFESGVPYTIFNGFDSDGVAGGLERPNYNPNGRAGVRAVPLVDANNNITGYYNPELVGGLVTTSSAAAAIDPNTARYIVNPAFVAGATGSVARFGSLGRNTERSKGVNNFDMTILKRTRISETIYIDTRAEFFNVWNHPQFGVGGNVANAATVGQFMNPINPTTSGGARVIRYQVKLVF